MEILTGYLSDLSAFISLSLVPLGRPNVLLIVGGAMIGSCHAELVVTSVPNAGNTSRRNASFHIMNSNVRVIYNWQSFHIAMSVY